MKRIQTFDLLRGLAILSMVVIHRIIWDFFRQHPEAEIFSVAFIILTLHPSGEGEYPHWLSINADARLSEGFPEIEAWLLEQVA